MWPIGLAVMRLYWCRPCLAWQPAALRLCRRPKMCPAAAAAAVSPSSSPVKDLCSQVQASGEAPLPGAPPRPNEASGSDAEALDDEAKLASLGYKQELKRSLSGFHNFAVSFTVVSILTGG